ncbi:MAG: hypothetical protein V4573_10760 [Pseudomonadota bacterium]
MSEYSVGSMLAAAVCSMGLGVVGHSIWQARKAKKKRKLPEQWDLQARLLLSSTELEVWHWLQRAFFEYDVLVKIPLIRFMAPRSAAEGKRSYELIKDLYCSFTICAVDGTVIGCVDVPGPQGLKASTRAIKQTLFAECGLAYAVVRAGILPTLEAVRSAFLGEVDLSDDEPAPVQAAPVPVQVKIQEPVVEAAATEPAPLDDMPIQTSAETSVQVDMLAVAEARNRLRAKLDRNRKIRFTNFDPLSTGAGAVPSGAGQLAPSQWEDSFIMSEAEQDQVAGKKEG